VNGRCRAGQVIDPIDFDKNRMDDIMSNKLKVGMRKQMSDVILTAREKVVDTKDVFISLQKCFTEMAAQKAGASSH
jgi:hypothetical protein